MVRAIQKIVWLLVIFSGLIVYLKKLISDQFFILVLIFIWLIFVFFLKKEKETKKESKVLFLIFFIFIFFFGIRNLFSLDKKINQPIVVNNYNKEVVMQGVVSAIPDTRINAKYLILKINSILVDGSEYNIDPKILIRARVDIGVTVGFGDQVSVSGKIKKPDNFLTDSRRIFDYKNYLLAKGVTAEVFVEEFNIKKESKNPIKFLSDIRERMLKKILKNSDFSSGAVMSGMLLGDQRFINDNLENIFRKSGLVHLLVLSGYNVALVSFFIFSVLGFLKERPKIIFSLIGILGFLILTGFQITVIRASLMIAIMFLAKFFGAKYDPIISLGIVCLFVFAFSPYAIIFDLGFVLSVLATIGILVVAPVFEILIKPKKYLPKILREVLIFSLATQIMVTPVLAYSVGQISVVSIFVNLLIVPIVPVIMFLGILVLAFGIFSDTTSFFLGQIASFFIEIILSVISFFANLPFSVFNVPEFSVFALFSTYLFLGLFLFRFYKKNKLELVRDF